MAFHYNLYTFTALSYQLAANSSQLFLSDILIIQRLVLLLRRVAVYLFTLLGFLGELHILLGGFFPRGFIYTLLSATRRL